MNHVCVTKHKVQNQKTAHEWNNRLKTVLILMRHHKKLICLVNKLSFTVWQGEQETLLGLWLQVWLITVFIFKWNESDASVVQVQEGHDLLTRLTGENKKYTKSNIHWLEQCFYILTSEIHLQYLVQLCLHDCNIPILIRLFNWLTNTASETVESFPSTDNLLKTIGPFYLIPFLPVETSGKCKQFALRRSYVHPL